MKRLSLFISLFAIVMALVGCSDNSPKAVAEKSMQCIIDKDFEGYTELLYIEPKEGQDIENQKAMIASMLKSKYESKVKKKGAVKSYEVLGEDIAEDGEKAVVTMKVVYDNGNVDENESIKLRKDKDGKWKLDAGK